MFFERLYVRIWLAVVLAVAVLTLTVGYVWRMTADPPLREVVVRNAAGEIIGTGKVRFGHPPSGSAWHLGGPAITSTPPPDPEDADDDTNEANLHGKFGAGPEATVRLLDGQTMHMHMPRPASGNWHAPFGFFWMLGLVAIAVALAIYPIVRRLTRRLEALQRDVERWGNGDLSVRMPTEGGDEVGFLAKGFNRAAEQVSTLMKTREDLLTSQKSLLANASHELRSPLTRIRMGIELMGGAPESAAKAELTRNINELDQLVGEILLASRLDAKEADLGTVEEVDLVGLCAEECARMHAQLDVEVASVTVSGVSKLLRRVVRNLLENANRSAAGEVTVSICQTGHDAVLQVKDRGPGVPAELVDRIFEPFYRLPGASERDGGVGLGLSLVRSITLRHGGSIRCSNREGGGACFEVRLPA